MSDEDRILATYRDYDASGRARLWDRSNRGYARLADERDQRLISLVAASLPKVDAPALLDVGCGDGSFATAVIDRWPSVSATGIDLLPERVEQARSREARATFVAGSAESLQFDDDSFDLVTAITLFSSLPSATMEWEAAREIDRVLRPGGWLIWYDLRRDNPWNRAVHGVTEAMLFEFFPGWRQELRRFTLAPPIARRLGPVTPIAYPLLHAIPLLRSHLIGRLQCPP